LQVFNPNYFLLIITLSPPKYSGRIYLSSE